MTVPKPDKTLADYIAIAIGPVLIMVMIGSLMFFLLEISYEGEYVGRLRWTTFWFVLASVLVSRISIEQGSGYAGVYGVALAAATGLMISRFVNFVLGVWCFLALIWWCASKLTWDCTLIDEDEDASGEGLLQVAGLDETKRPANSRESPAAQSGATVPLWRRLTKNRSERAGQPHAPGLWVVYFSLIALPLFGVGQLLIPHNDASRRRFGFVLLLVYAAAGLGLLLTTSFLGLRRYLRQRRLEMPADVARTWIGLGTALAAGILLFCILFPRPEAEYSLSALAGRIGSPGGVIPEYPFFFDNSGEGEEAREGKGKNGNQKTGAGVGGESVPGQNDGAEINSSQNSRLGPSKSAGSMAALWLARILKWIVYGLFALLVIYCLIRNWSRLVEAVQQIARDLWEFLRKLFGLGRPSSRLKPQGTESLAAGETQRSFASFQNPFVTGDAQRMSPTELVCYSFEALQAWARGHGVPRRPEQTPLEFADLLGRASPEWCADVAQVTQLYGRIAYAGRPPAATCVDLLEGFWRRMASTEFATSSSSAQ